MKFELVGPAYTQPSLDANAQECINWYPVIDQVTPRTNLFLSPRPGLSLAVDLETSKPIQMLATDNINAYAISNGNLFKLTPSGNYTTFSSINIGATLLDTNAIIPYAFNSSNQLCFADSTYGYVYNTSTNILTQLDITLFNGAISMTYMDGYIFYVPENNNTVCASPIDNAIDFDPIDTTTFNAKSDKVLAVFGNRRDLWVIGNNSAEIWYNAGNAQFPFSRRDSIQVDRGTAASNSVIGIDNTLAWLDDLGQVIIIDGYNPKVISTEPMHASIRKYDTISDCYACSYQENGQWFAEFTFPSAEVSWVFSMATQLWHKRAYWDSANAGQIRNKINSTILLNNNVFAGSYNDGKIYYSDDNAYTDYGNAIIRTRISSHSNIEFEKIRIHSLELKTEGGTGLASGQGSAPQISLQVSKDGGHTYGSEKWRYLAEIGNYRKRVRWNRLGISRSFTFKLTISDPIKCVLLDASAEITGMPGKPNATIQMAQ